MKDTDHSILLAILPLPCQGEQDLQGRLSSFLQALRNLLVQVGSEAVGSNAELMLIYYDEPFTALSIFFESLEFLKKHQWQSDWGLVPIKFILHLQRKNHQLADFGESTAAVWWMLQPETPYVTRALKLHWDQLFAGKKLPAHQFLDVGNGLFQLSFSGNLSELKRDRIFTGRFQAAKGLYSVCFYCGMTSHIPANCPSKQLTMETSGLNMVGYLPLSQIDSLFKRVMAEQDKMAELLAANIDAAQISSDPALQVYVSYFDMYLIYQHRFMIYSAFSPFSSWDGGVKSNRVKIERLWKESRNLHAGFDCLRLGQYKQAVDLLNVENHDLELVWKKFYAALGLAFIALECGRMVDMANFLQMASGTASTTKDKIYISLILARFHRLAGEHWKAEQLLGSVASLYVDCPEVQYGLIQARVQEGVGQQQMQLLRKVVEEDRRYFLIALMDPDMLEVDSIVENVLSGLLELKNKEAGDNLAEAQGAWAQLQTWFGTLEDEELRANLKVLANLEKQLVRHSVYDIFDVGSRAKYLNIASASLRKARLDELTLQLDAVAIDWENHLVFWQEYPYQSFFGDVKDIISSGKKNFTESRSIASESLAKARMCLQAGQDLEEILTRQIKRMLKFQLVMNIMGTFFKKLMIAELVLSVLAFFVLQLITIVLSGVLGQDFVHMAQNPQVQKSCMFILALFLAPFFALVLTIRSIADKSNIH